MPTLIDGNNLLYAALDESPDRPPGRARLCKILADWADRTGERVTVVFDGPEPAEALAGQIAAAGLEVRYSGPRKADDLIIDLIRVDSAPRRLSVVSSDRQIARAASRRGAAPEKSDQFWRLVKDSIYDSKPPPLEPDKKRSGPLPGAEDEWLKVFDVPFPPTVARLPPKKPGDPPSGKRKK